MTSQYCRYAFIPDRLWDGVSDTPVEDLAIIINDETIEQVTPIAQLDANIPRVDAPGCTAIPGMVDMHVHYTHVTGRAFLAAGVTTVRDVGNDLDWILNCRELTRFDPSIGPDIVCTGFLIDADPPFWSILGRGNADEETMRATIREHCARGVDAIKLYAKLGLDLFRVGVDEAHAQGMKVLAHLGGLSAEDAIAAGIDDIQHLSNCGPAWKNADDDEQDEFIDLVLGNSVVLTPTLVVWDRIARQVDLVFRHDQRRRWMHPTYVDLWDCKVTHDRNTRMNLQEMGAHLKRFIHRAHKRGVLLPVGTDTPWINLVPGFSVHDELSFYVDAGISCVDTLRCATSVAAGVLGREDTIGQIKSGMHADIAVVRGNPLENIADIALVEATIHRGRLLKSEDLYTAQAAGYDSPANEPQAWQWQEMQGK
jgi:imidazolonepropionase-like amidohydrolase